MQTGDVVVYTAGSNSTPIEGLVEGQAYYVNLLETLPVPIFALYSMYQEAVLDHSRVQLVTTGSGIQNFSVGAIASCVTSSTPTRENNISIKFDRTSYNSQVIPCCVIIDTITIYPRNSIRASKINLG